MFFFFGIQFFLCKIFKSIVKYQIMLATEKIREKNCGREFFFVCKHIIFYNKKSILFLRFFIPNHGHIRELVLLLKHKNFLRIDTVKNVTARYWMSNCCSPALGFEMQQTRQLTGWGVFDSHVILCLCTVSSV